jgi:hypothetical protein
VDAEELRRGPAEPVRFGAELVEEGERVLAHRLPLRRQQVPAGRGVLGQALDLIAPRSDGGRKVGHAGRGTAERLLKRKSPPGPGGLVQPRRRSQILTIAARTERAEPC